VRVSEGEAATGGASEGEAVRVRVRARGVRVRPSRPPLDPDRAAWLQEQSSDLAAAAGEEGLGSGLGLELE